MTLANYISLLRLFISPLFLLLYLEYEFFHIAFTTLPYILFTLLVISELSDALDGYLARKWGEVTDLGKILDPTTDSIYRITLFLTFTIPPVQLPMIFVLILLYRDTITSTLRTLCALNGYALAARWSGKVKAAIQGCSAGLIVLLLIPYSHGMISQDTLQTTSSIIVFIATLYSIYSGVDYILANLSYIKTSLLKAEKVR